MICSQYKAGLKKLKSFICSKEMNDWQEGKLRVGFVWRGFCLVVFLILYFQLTSVTYKNCSTFEKVTRHSKSFYTYILNLVQNHVFLRKNAISLGPASRKEVDDC